MKFALAALSALLLAAPGFAADLEDRHHQESVKTVTVTANAEDCAATGGLVTGANAQQAFTVTVTSPATVTVDHTVTVTDGGNTAASVETPPPSSNNNSGSSSGSNRNGSGNNRGHSHHTTTRVVKETVTHTRTKTVLVTHAATVTEAARFTTRTKTVDVTSTSTDVVQETEIVTHTVTDTDTVTSTDANQAQETGSDNSTTDDSGSIADANTNTDVATVTDVITSTFVVTTTVDGQATTETGTTTFTTTSAEATSTDSTGTIADNGGGNNNNSTSSDNSGSGNNDDPQKSLTVDPRVIESAFASDGQATPTPGQVASLTSTNNFVNFCLTQNVPLTDGKQIRAGSCNVVPQGRIIAKDKIPSAKFTFPPNFGKIPANQTFTIKLKLNNLQAGAFTNAQTNYYAAPAQVNSDGVLIGHSHVVIEPLPSLDHTDPLDPTTFSFFKGLNADLDADSSLSASVDSGLPAGVYRAFSINTAANHQPALASVAQHGCMDDAIYFTVE